MVCCINILGINRFVGECVEVQNDWSRQVNTVALLSSCSIVQIADYLDGSFCCCHNSSVL